MWGSGFIPIIIYATGIATTESEKFLLTENNFEIFTESNSPISTE